MFDYYVGNDEKRNREQKRLHDEHISKIHQIATKYNLIKLKCSYLDVSSYYYDKVHDQIYEVYKTYDPCGPRFMPINDDNIRKENGLKIQKIPDFYPASMP